jgi:phosphatidylethanolamine/phosphatidyl-N-methylethanolamine N-methyltransferase
MAPLSRRLGWHPDFALRDLLDPERITVESIEPCPPVGIFTLVQMRNPLALSAALAAE